MKCKLCEENFDTKYRIPRNLNCGHCFCEQCLKIYQKNEEVECPKCTKKSPSKLPICYAIFELIDHEDTKKNDYCINHPLEKIQFYCNTDYIGICIECILLNHNGHMISSIRENSITKEIKKDFQKLYEGVNAKLNYLKNMKSEVEKCEDFLNKMYENQKGKLTEIGISFQNKKKEKIEELIKIIELNYLNQHELFNKMLIETEHKKNYIDIYSSKISELLLSFSKNLYLIKSINDNL